MWITGIRKIKMIEKIWLIKKKMGWWQDFKNDPWGYKVNLPYGETIQNGISYALTDGGKWLGVPVTLGQIGGDKTRQDVTNAVKTGDYKPVYQNLAENFKNELTTNVTKIVSVPTNYVGDMFWEYIEKMFGSLNVGTIALLIGGAAVSLIILKKI